MIYNYIDKFWTEIVINNTCLCFSKMDMTLTPFNEMQNYINSLEKEKKDLAKKIQDTEKLKVFLENTGFPILSFSQFENALTIYTPDYSQMLECGVVNLQQGVEIIHLEERDKDYKPEEFYTKGFQFSANKQIGHFALEILLKDEDAEKRKMNVLYEYNSKSGIRFPNSYEKLLDFYKSKNLKPSVMIKLKNIIKMSEVLLK